MESRAESLESHQNTARRRAECRRDARRGSGADQGLQRIPGDSAAPANQASHQRSHLHHGAFRTHRASERKHQRAQADIPDPVEGDYTSVLFERLKHFSHAALPAGRIVLQNQTHQPQTDGRYDQNKWQARRRGLGFDPGEEDIPESIGDQVESRGSDSDHNSDRDSRENKASGSRYASHANKYLSYRKVVIR